MRRSPTRRTAAELRHELRAVIGRAEELLADAHQQDRILYRLDSAAAALDTSPETLRTWARAGRLTPTRIGRNLYFARDDLAAFVSAHRRPANGDGATS